MQPVLTDVASAQPAACPQHMHNTGTSHSAANVQSQGQGKASFTSSDLAGANQASTVTRAISSSASSHVLLWQLFLLLPNLDQPQPKRVKP
ncbi:hypothetical protein TGAMA5MH_07542 [Trichoderma gamsii]|uniref:Uncharacterized protein n=1 Tax=Trichoderma gamsii TaxID=398673 RepID=A0A2K0T4T6_9HYPO|nr:hypothetical protein TGAMA5MH_07542 [Trichoderma gamsii]